MSAEESQKFDLTQLLGDKLVWKEDGKAVLQPISRLQNSYVGIYFSAHWCPPCRQFTPQLVHTYQQLKGKRPFEVVFVSSDRNVEAFSEYFETMPWAAVPFGEYNLRKELGAKFGVMSIPSLVILAPDGTLINASARSEVSRDPKGVRFPWHGSKQLSGGGGLDTTKIVIILLVAYLLYRIVT